MVTTMTTRSLLNDELFSFLNLISFCKFSKEITFGKEKVRHLVERESLYRNVVLEISLKPPILQRF